MYGKEELLPPPPKKSVTQETDDELLPPPPKKKDLPASSGGVEKSSSPTQSQSLFGKFPTKDEYYAKNPTAKKSGTDNVLQPPKQVAIKDNARIVKPIVGETLDEELANRERYQQTKEKREEEAIAKMRATVPESLGGTMEKERASPGTAFAKGAASVVSSTLKSIGIAAKNLDFFNEYDGKKAEDLATYKAGQWIEDKVSDLVGELSDEDKERFSIKLAEGAGQMVGFMFGGISGKVIKASPFATTALLGAAVSGANEYEAALQAGASEDMASKAFWINATLGTTEALPIMGAFRKMDKYTGGMATGVLAKKLKSNANRELTNEMVGGIVKETAQEVFVQALSNVSAEHTYDATRKIYDGLLETAAVSSIIGGAMTGTAIAIRNKRAAGGLTKEEDNQLAAAQKFAEDKAEESFNPEKKEFTTPTPNNPKVKSILKAKTDIEADLASEDLPQETMDAMKSELSAIDQQLEVAKTEAYQQELDDKTATILKNDIEKNEALLSNDNLTESTKVLLKKQIDADKEKLSKIKTSQEDNTYLINGERVSEEVFLSNLESKKPVDYEYNGENPEIIQKLKDVGGKSETTTTEEVIPETKSDQVGSVVDEGLGGNKIIVNMSLPMVEGVSTGLVKNSKGAVYHERNVGKLKKLGYSDEQIDNMSQNELNEVLGKNIENPNVESTAKLPLSETQTTTNELINEAINSGGHFSELAKALKQFFGLGDVKTSIVKGLKNFFGGKSDGDYANNEIRIDEKAKNKVQTFLHEAVHKITVEKLLQFERGDFSKLSEKDIDALKNLKRIFEESKIKIHEFLGGGKGDRTKGHYGFTDLHEFISEAFANPEFQRLLREIPTEGKTPNLFKQFLDALAKFLGIKDGSILNDIFYHTEQLQEKQKEQVGNVVDWSKDVESTAQALEKGNGNSNYYPAVAKQKAEEYHRIKNIEENKRSEQEQNFVGNIEGLLGKPSEPSSNTSTTIKTTNEGAGATTEVTEPIQQNESKPQEQGTEAAVLEGTQTTGQGNAETATTVLDESGNENIPPEPPAELPVIERSEEGRLRDKGILSSMIKSVPESQRAKVEAKGLKYKVASQAEAKSIATNIIEDNGLDTALDYASNAKLDGDIRAQIYNVALNKLGKQEVAETDPMKKEELGKRYAEVLMEFDEMGRGAGRFSSAIYDFYKSPLGIEFYEAKKKEKLFKEEQAKNGKSWDEFYDEFKDEPEFAAMVQAKIFEEKAKDKTWAKKTANSLRKKADDILKNGVTPDWLKSDIKNAKTKGIDAKAIDKAIAGALKIIADVLEVGGNVASVISEQVKKIKELGVTAKDAEIAKWLYKESGASGMSSKTFEQKISERINSLQESIADYKKKLADKEYADKEKPVTNEKIKELEEELKATKKAYFDARKDFPAYQKKVSERYLERMRKKLKGLNEKQQREVIEQSFRKLTENGALDETDFRDIIKNALGLGKLDDAKAAELKSYVADINAVDDATDAYIESGGSKESLDALTKAKNKALVSKQRLAEIVHNDTDLLGTLRAAMQLNSIGLVTVLKNIPWNIANASIKFTGNLAISLADAAVSKAANIVSGGKINKSLLGTSVLGVQKPFFRNLGEGLREGKIAVKSGVNSKDYFDKEHYSKPIQPVKNAAMLLDWAKGNQRMGAEEVADRAVKATAGYHMELISRFLTLFDKPLRYGAEGGAASRIGSKEMGLKGKELEMFINAPKAFALKYYTGKGDDIATATKKAESIQDRIVEAGDKSVSQQSNLLSDVISAMGKGVDNITEKMPITKVPVTTLKVVASPAALFVKTPANVAWQVFNLINPSVAFTQSAAFSTIAYRKYKKGDVTYKQDIDRAKDWMGTAAVGLGLGVLSSFLANAGVIEAGEDDKTNKKERDATKEYSKKSTFNISKFYRLLSGQPDSKDDEDLRIDLTWFGQLGSVMDLKERMRDLKKDEPDMSDMNTLLSELDESARIAISSSVLNSASALSQAFSSYNGFESYGVNSINTMANIFHPQTFSQTSRAALDKEYQIKADSFLKRLDNSFAARSSLYRKLTGHYPPSDIGIWGDEIRKGGNPALRYFGISKDVKNKFAEDIYNDFEKTGDLKFLPPAVKNTITKNGVTVKLSNEAERYLEQQVGAERKKLVTAFTDGALKGYGDYKTLSKDDKLDALSVIYNAGYEIGKYNFYQKYPQYNVEKTESQKIDDKKDSKSKKELKRSINKMLPKY